MYLSDLKAKQRARVIQVHGSPLLKNRLETLGFTPPTEIRVITKGFFGGDPILVQIGFTQFALRKSEAQCISVEGINL